MIESNTIWPARKSREPLALGIGHWCCAVGYLFWLGYYSPNTMPEVTAHGLLSNG